MCRTGNRCFGPRVWAVAAAVATATSLPHAPISADTLGMAADRFTRSVTVFDADTHQVIGTVALPDQDGATVGDCSIARDNRLGFVTDFKYRVWLIDLETAALADGINPISITTPGNDTVITPDGRYLLACDGEAPAPMSVVDLEARAEIGTFELGRDCTSVDVCADGSVLATTSDDTVRRLVIDADGTLHDTGEVLRWSEASVGNVFCAPDARTGIVTSGSANLTGNGFRSFSIPGSSLIEWKQFGSRYASGAFGPLGETLYLRSFSRLEARGYDPARGTFSQDPLYVRMVDPIGVYYGMEQLAFHPNGHALYVGQNDRIDVIDPATGTTMASIAAPAINRASGICVQSSLDAAIDIRPGDPLNTIHPGSPVPIVVAVLGSDHLEAEEIDPSTLRFGPARASPVGPRFSAIRDVNQDGHLDLTARFHVDASGIESGDVESCVEGRTHEGVELRGCDAITILPACGRGFQVAMLVPALTWLRRERRSVR